MVSAPSSGHRYHTHTIRPVKHHTGLLPSYIHCSFVLPSDAYNAQIQVCAAASASTETTKDAHIDSGKVQSEGGDKQSDNDGVQQRRGELHHRPKPSTRVNQAFQLEDSRATTKRRDSSQDSSEKIATTPVCTLLLC